MGIEVKETVLNEDNKHKNTWGMFPIQKYYKTMFVWIRDPENLKKLVILFDDSVLICDQYVNIGIYHESNQFLFFEVDPMDVFQNKRLREHARVSVLMMPQKEVILFKVFNFFKAESDKNFDKAELIEPSYLWKSKNIMRNQGEIFMSQKDFHSKMFKVYAVPWATNVIADPVPEDKNPSPYFAFENYWGYEVSLMETISAKLNFKFRFYNPPKGDWGYITENGTWTGMIGEIKNSKGDILICDHVITHRNYQVNKLFNQSLNIFYCPVATDFRFYSFIAT